MNESLHAVEDLPPIAREALASVAGFPLNERQQFYVVLLQPGDAPAKHRALDELQRIGQEAERNIAARGIMSEELDTLIDCVSDDVRRGRT